MLTCLFVRHVLTVLELLLLVNYTCVAYISLALLHRIMRVNSCSNVLLTNVNVYLFGKYEEWFQMFTC